jgi:hypothetical protein
MIKFQNCLLRSLDQQKQKKNDYFKEFYESILSRYFSVKITKESLFIVNCRELVCRFGKIQTSVISYILFDLLSLAVYQGL